MAWLGAPPVAVASLAALPARGMPTVCPFALVTGIACPGCGLTRAASALVRGDVMAALELHPLVLLAVGWGIAVWAVGALRRSGHPVGAPARLVNRLLTVTGATVVVTWLIRLAAGTLPPV